MAERQTFMTTKQPADAQEFAHHLETMAANRWELVSSTYVNGPGPYSWWHSVFRKKVKA